MNVSCAIARVRRIRFHSLDAKAFLEFVHPSHILLLHYDPYIKSYIVSSVGSCTLIEQI